jgi:hypothetical protein
MADSFEIGRGNPGSSPVQNDDISKVTLESPLELRSQLTVEVQNCADVQESPCDTLVLNIYNVMGQEDKYRRVDGQRVDNGGTARIVLTTNERSNITAVDYASNPSNEDSPTLDKTWMSDSEGKKYHEFFVATDPSSLYAFQVTAKATDCPDTVETSDIYYFSTGDEIVFKKVFGDENTYSIDVLSVNKYLQPLDIDFNDEQGIVPKTNEVDWTTSQSMTNVLIATNEFQEIDITDSFSYTIS